MKKKSVLILIGVLLLGLTSQTKRGVNAFSSDYSSINDVLNEYYNEGYYTRKTYINFNDIAINESLEQYFIGGVSLERTTYFKDETLLMGNIDGSIGGINGINSGYTTIDNNLYHYVLDLDNKVIDESTLRKDVSNSSLTDFFVTMDDFAFDYVDDLWSKEGNIYSYYPSDVSYNIETKSYNDKVLDDFLQFTASCFYNADKDNYNYITLSHVEIEEISNHLELRLFADSTESGKLKSSDCLLSVAKVYKGFLPVDNQGYYLGIDDQYQRISSFEQKDIILNEGEYLSFYDSYSKKDYVFSNSLVKASGYYNLSIEINKGDYILIDQLLYENIPNREYLENEDSVEGIDTSDLSLLKELFDSINKNYTLKTQTYFNKAAVNRVNKIYSTNYIQNKVTKVVDDIIYISNHSGHVNEYYYYDENIKVGKLIDGEVTNVTNLLQEVNDSYEPVTEELSSYFFTLDNLNSNYVDTYGPCTVKYTSTYSVDYDGWTRIGENKFKCDREEVLKHFLKFISPGFRNGGTYMTYRYVTVEILEEGVKFRLYASPTQIGKIIDAHLLQQEKPNWYLLYAEGLLTNIGTTSI